MKYAHVKKLWIREAKKSLRSTRREGITNLFASTTIADGRMTGIYALYEAAHTVSIFSKSILVYAYVRGLMDREDMYVKYMPVLKAMEHSLYSKRAERMFNLAIDYINGNKDTKDSLTKAVATFYKVAKEG